MSDNPSDPVESGSIPQRERPAADAAFPPITEFGDLGENSTLGELVNPRPADTSRTPTTPRAPLPPRADRVAAITGTTPTTKSNRTTGAVPVTRAPGGRATGAVPVTRTTGAVPATRTTTARTTGAVPVTGLDQSAAAAPGAAPSPSGAAPGVTGVLLFPGLAVWRRTPVIGALLFAAGVIAPFFTLLMTWQHRDDLIGLFARPAVLRGTTIVALAAITSRIIAVFLTADRIPDADAARAMRRRGAVAVVLLAIPTTFAVVRMEQARSVVKEVFGEDSNTGAVTAVGDQRASEYHTVLMMGSDEGSDRLGLRTDTMILAMVHQPTGHTALVSVPRNLTKLQFPPGSPMAEKYPNGFDDLVNAVYEAVDTDPELKAAYTDGVTEPGIRALMEGLSYSLGIGIDDYVIVNSCAFVRVVDAIGGVTIDIDKELPMPAKLRCSNYRLPKTIGPGPTLLDGTKALGYVRSRKADSDYQRMERQRILLQTIAKEIGISDLLTKFTELADIVKDDVRTSMTVDEARTLLAYLQSDNGEFKSIGLVPPIVKPGDPDYDSLRDYLQRLRDNVSQGLEPPVVTDPTATNG
jgi:LCP family protein required for cell wall assembly